MGGFDFNVIERSIGYLFREGMTWSDMRLRALGAAPVRLSPRPSDGATETFRT